MPGYHLGYQFESVENLQTLRVQQGGQGTNASDYAMQLVLNQDVWAAILINPNATVLATEAANNGNGAYDSRGAISFFYEEGRNFYAANQYVVFLGSQVIQSGIAQASRQFVSQLTGSAAALSTAAAGNALSYPFYYSQFNLRPFEPLAAEPTSTAGSMSVPPSPSQRDPADFPTQISYHFHILRVLPARPMATSLKFCCHRFPRSGRARSSRCAVSSQ